MPIPVANSARQVLWAALLVAPLAALLFRFPIHILPKHRAAEPKVAAAMDPSPEIEYDMPGVLRLHKSGRVERFDGTETVPPSPSGDPANGVASKDVVLDPEANISARLYLPAAAAAEPGKKFPVVVFFHGGAFMVHTAASPLYHKYAAALAAAAPAVVVSVDYRLAPEHRLPAAFDDAADAVRWVRSYAAGRPVFIMGCHNGASIAFRAALAAVDQGVELRGLILNQAHHSGVERTPAEEASVDDRVLPLPANDLLWELALPVGADRDHEYCNPGAMLAGVGASQLRRLPPCLVLGRKKDPPRDRQKVLVDALRDAGVDVEARMDGAGYHAMELFKADRAAEFVAQVTDFVRRHAVDDVQQAGARSRM